MALRNKLHQNPIISFFFHLVLSSRSYPGFRMEYSLQVGSLNYECTTHVGDRLDRLVIFAWISDR